MFWFLPLIALYVPPIAMLIAFIIYFWKILVSIFSIIPPIMEMAALLFLNPTRLFNDIITGVTIGITMLIQKVMDVLNPNILKDKKITTSNVNNSNKYNCYSTSFMNLVLLIICPPFAVYQAHGFAFHEIFLCTLLTVYGYYFPGLLYAIIVTSKNIKMIGKSHCK